MNIKNTNSQISSVEQIHYPTEYATAQPKKLSVFHINKHIALSMRLIDSGFQVIINKSSLNVRYPKSLWERFPKFHKTIVSQNIMYSSTFQLPYLFPSVETMTYAIPVPLSEAFFFKALSFALPGTAIMQTQKELRKTSNFFRRLLDVTYVFTNAKTLIPSYNRKSFGDHAVMPFTFGKDSLLTFAIARELGIHIHPVYVGEPYSPYEQVIKQLLAQPFRKEFHIKLSVFNNTLGIFRDPVGWFGWELQLTQYTLMLLPYVYAKKAGYIFFSNEQSCNETIIDEDGFKCNPVFEQSHAWMLQNSLMTSLIGGNSLSIGSLLEPLHDLAIIKILHTRYPEIGKYQSSCDLPQKPKDEGRWCENCSKCARIYIFLLATGIDPKRVGFRHNLLRMKYLPLYALFSSSKIKEFGYDQAQIGHDEQVFAFYLAYMRGIRGGVMREFVKHYLPYAKKNERRFRKTFYSLHSTKTIPYELRAKVLKIYRQELNDLT